MDLVLEVFRQAGAGNPVALYMAAWIAGVPLATAANVAVKAYRRHLRAVAWRARMRGL